MNEDNNRVLLLDISTIKIVNPRKRNRQTHDEITNNIDKVGLKRPITVRKINERHYQYALICGQGRIEAYSKLGQKKIPAIIKEVDEEIGHIMSLVENIARRKPRATELLERVRDLKSQGLSDNDIGSRLGYSTNWVNNITLLLDKGEQKLLTAIEAGHIPLYLAVDIARANDEEIQTLLIDAYNNGVLKSKQIAIVRKIIDRRTSGDKGTNNLSYVQHRSQKKLTSAELSEVYQKNIEEHKNVQLKSNFTRESLMLAKEIMSQLLNSHDFISIIKNEKLNNIPTQIMNNATPDKG